MYAVPEKRPKYTFRVNSPATPIDWECKLRAESTVNANNKTNSISYLISFVCLDERFFLLVFEPVFLLFEPAPLELEEARVEFFPVLLLVGLVFEDALDFVLLVGDLVSEGFLVDCLEVFDFVAK